MTMDQMEQRTRQFRQQTGGGVPGTTYIRKSSDGFEVKFKMAEGSPVNARYFMDNVINAISMASQQLGMSVKIKDKSEAQ